jgi:hypothetical protein
MTTPKIVVVTGSRRWSDKASIWNALFEQAPNLVIHGGANGADALAGRWANENAVTCLVVPALWEGHGKKAGTIRNIDMLAIANDLKEASGAELIVLGFPAKDSIGTKHCMSSATQMGMLVLNKGEL